MHFQVALGIRPQSVLAHARNLHFTSPEGEGFQPSPKETLKKVIVKRKERIWVVVSAVWIIVAMAVAASESSEYLRDGGLVFSLGKFLPSFLLIGILPPVIGWGIYWIKKG